MWKRENHRFHDCKPSEHWLKIQWQTIMKKKKRKKKNTAIDFTEIVPELTYIYTSKLIIAKWKNFTYLERILLLHIFCSEYYRVLLDCTYLRKRKKKNSDSYTKTSNYCILWQWWEIKGKLLKNYLKKHNLNLFISTEKNYNSQWQSQNESCLSEKREKTYYCAIHIYISDFNF